MRRVGVCVVLAWAWSATTWAEPYEDPPFTRFPDEPAELPPLHQERTYPWYERIHPLRGATLRVLVGANAPLAVAAGLEVAFPWHLWIGATLGVFPKSVERAVNHELVDHGVYEASLGDLVDASLEQVVEWHGYLGVKPWTHHGLFATAGYTVAWVNGRASVPQVATAVGEMIPDQLPVDRIYFDLASRIHLVDLELGWEWRLPHHWSIRLAIGAAITVTARTRVSAEPAITDPRFGALAGRAQATLDHAYNQYVRTPLISSFLAYEL
ncbi:MAG: hypothetical protein ABI678_03380 [Kofleriaceae bacterium]